MISMKRILISAATVALVAAGIAVSAGSASAYVACNREGDCWHTDNNRFDRRFGITVHPDDWYFHQDWRGHDRRLRDYRDGRGYYRRGIWIPF